MLSRSPLPLLEKYVGSQGPIPSVLLRRVWCGCPAGAQGRNPGL